MTPTKRISAVNKLPVHSTAMTANFEYLDELFLDLKILAEVGQHEKISTKTTRMTVKPDGFYLAFMRFIGRESRENNLERIKDLIVKATREIEEFTSGRRTSSIIMRRMKDHLVAARSGIDNLCYTYKDDANMKSELGQQLDKLDDQVAIIEVFERTARAPCVHDTSKKNV